MLPRLHAHRAWANIRQIDWLHSLPSPDAYCLKALSHVLLAERAWLQRLATGRAEVDTNAVLTAEGLKAQCQANEAEWPSHLASDLGRVCHYRRFDGQESESTVGDILTHVCTHGAYHRGQVSAQAARLGLHVPPTDFIVFARENPEQI